VGAPAFPPPGTPPNRPGGGTPATAPPTELLLGTYRDIWSGPVTELNPPLRFLLPKQRLELSQVDAERLHLQSGYEVRVSQGDNHVDAIVQIKERVPDGVCFLSEGLTDANANALLNGGPVRVTVSQPERIEV
jgi:predicted molibdopterin-dependent oxidoreductase YjgC